MGTVKIRRDEGVSGPYSWRAEVQLEEREREMTDLRNERGLWAGSQLGHCSPALCWQRGTGWPGGADTAATKWELCWDWRGYFWEATECAKIERIQKHQALLGICDNKLSWKAGNFTLVQRNCNCSCALAFSDLQIADSLVYNLTGTVCGLRVRFDTCTGPWAAPGDLSAKSICCWGWLL